MSLAKVDLLVGYKVQRKEEPWGSLIRPQMVCLTPLQGFETNFLGVIPVEIKNATGDSYQVRCQLALYSSAMLQLWQDMAAQGSQEQLNNGLDTQKLPIVLSLSIVGHIWTYYITFLEQPEKASTSSPSADERIVLGPFFAGNTMSLLSTFQLFHFLTVLRDWVVEKWAPMVYKELYAMYAPAGIETQA